MRKFVTLITMLMLSGVLAFSQGRIVTGTVTDEKGSPIEGATVRIKGSKSGVAADQSGSFRISVPANGILTVSGVGIAPQDFPVGNQTTLNLTLSRSGAPELTTVVVTAAGIRRSEKSLGYAISKVDPNTLVQQSEPDVLKSLQGKVAGVDIRQSEGVPGAATRIQIRGNSSFGGDNQPLFIVDGVPYSNTQVSTSSQTVGGAYGSGISDLDPNDIASMNVLKGSAASALYGSRASNGVIIITTKSGSASRSRKGLEVNMKNSVSFETIANLPDLQNAYGTGANFQYSNSNGSWGPAFGLGRTWNGSGQWAANTSGTDSIPAWPEFKAAFPSLFPSANIAYVGQPNNVKNLFQTGLIFENSVGFNGGDEKTSFALTASALNHKGYVPNSAFNRYNLSMGGGTKLAIGLNLRGNFAYSRSDQAGGFYGENQQGSTSEFARSLFLGRNWNTDLPYTTPTGGNPTWNGGAQFDNPKWAYEHNRVLTNEERSVAGMHADFSLTKWAHVDYTIGSNVMLLSRKEIIDIGSRAASGTGSIVTDDYRNQEIESTLLLRLNPSIGNSFTLTSTLGTDYNQRTATRKLESGTQFVASAFTNPGFVYNLTNASQQTFSGDTYSRRRILGVFGDITLGYKNYAFITATGRNDWSSTLAPANRSYFYPSVSGSLVFTDALKLKSKILDYGKLRAGWAKVGRDANPYQLYDVLALGTNFLGQNTASFSTQANNAAIQPEFTREVELGTELSFFNRKVGLDFTWYDKKSTNLILGVTVASSTGYRSQVSNVGGISNKGVEIELTLRPIKTKNFGWEIKTIYTQNKNIVTALVPGLTRTGLGGGSTNLTTELEPGLPFGYFYGTRSARDSATGALLIDPTTGGIIADKTNGYVGDPNPKFKLGITNTFNYKGFFLSTLFDMTDGGNIYSVTINSELGRGVAAITQDRLSSWVIPGVYGDATTGKAILSGGKTIPNQTRISTNDLYFYGSPAISTFAINSQSEWQIYDATVYRLRELTIGYQIPKSVFKKLPIGAITFSVTGRNLWYYAPGVPKGTNFDPEVGTYGSSSVQGLELSAAPTTKRFGFNLNVTF